MPEIITRAEWGAKPAKAVTRWDPDDLLGVAVHHFAKPRALKTLAGSKSQMRAVQAVHMGPGGLGTKDGGNDIAYNHCVDVRGAIFEGRGFLAQTGANGNEAVNRTHASVCFMGDSDLDGFPEAAQASIAWLLAEWFKRGVSMRAVAHGDISPDGTACPGNRAEAWVHSGAWKKDLPSAKRVEFVLMDDGVIVDRSRRVPIEESLARWNLFKASDAGRKAHDRMAAEGAKGRIGFERRVLMA